MRGRKYFQFVLLTAFLLAISPSLAGAQTHYTLAYMDSTAASVKITIEPASPFHSSMSFVMPRSIPGSYGICGYDAYVEQIVGVTTTGERLILAKDENDAPRWRSADSTKKIKRIEYTVNLRKMERKMSPGDASIIRTGFAGLFNYSVFGWIDGLELEPVAFTVATFSTWRVFSTLMPAARPILGTINLKTDNYYKLADGQTFMGPAFRVKEYKGVVPLFVVSYCQSGDEYLDDYGTQGTRSMDILKDYFGEIPFPFYSLMLLKTVPLESGSAPALAMEHLQSSTFFGDTTNRRRKAMSDQDIIRTMPTYLHHMSHAFIPLRCYGDRYQPHVMEIPPVMSNIWFNEGFMWFLAYDTLKVPRMKVNFTRSTYATSPTIKAMDLSYLSQIASTLYGTDFRIGRAVYSRGALMAMEMNTQIKQANGGKKTMKNVLRYLYQWSQKNQRAFTPAEFQLLINAGSGTDLNTIYKKWCLPIASKP